jgi:hypothetical protein
MQQEKNDKEKTLLSFLKQTKDGKYAKVDESSLAYVRVKEEREEIEAFAETYYYSLS